MTGAPLYEKLLPCPFCGGEGAKLRTDPKGAMSWVSCPECGLEAPTETGVCEGDAVEYWNRRASPSQVAPRPQAGEPIGYLVQGFDGEPFFAPDREQYDRQGHAVVPVYASPQAANPAQVMDAQIKHMVERFLSWKLPKDFNPDGGISFKREFNEHTPPPMIHQPYGTNLFDYGQAKVMVEHMLEGFAAIGAGGQAIDQELRDAAKAMGAEVARNVPMVGAGGQAVAVKALEWYPDPGAFPAPTWGAQSSFGRYTIEEVSASDSPAYEVRYTPHHLVAIKDGLDEAKAAAQKDYERRVLSALSQPHPADERVVEALREAEETLRLVEHPAFPDPVHHDEVKRLGRRIGFGALMSTASAAWREELAADGGPVGGEFVAGPCHSSIVRALSIVREALSAKEGR